MQDQERIQRAFGGFGGAHRMYLLERAPVREPGAAADGAEAHFVVLGATKNVYTVTIGRHLHCTCPDFAKGNVCKHQLFVMLRVLKLGGEDTAVWQRALLPSEVRVCAVHTKRRFLMRCCFDALSRPCCSSLCRVPRFARGVAAHVCVATVCGYSVLLLGVVSSQHRTH